MDGAPDDALGERSSMDVRPDRERGDANDDDRTTVGAGIDFFLEGLRGDDRLLGEDGVLGMAGMVERVLVAASSRATVAAAAAATAAALSFNSSTGV